MYRSLDTQAILTTIGRLCERIEKRFPDSSLGRVGRELEAVAQRAVASAESVRRPHVVLRASIALLVLLIGAVLVLVLSSLRLSWQLPSIVDFVQAIESGVNDVVFIGIGIFFLVRLEDRIKRRAILKAMHELRSLAHIIDMHQLTKDPHMVLPGYQPPPGSTWRPMTAFELARYLDYCSEMLALVGKVAALYAQWVNDAVVLSAVDEIETLTNGLSRKMWQKISLINGTEKKLALD